MMYDIIHFLHYIVSLSYHFLGIGDLLFLYSLTWCIVCFGANGISGSNLSISRDRGKVYLRPTSPGSTNRFAICEITGYGCCLCNN
ncbi:hypothetical protein Hanom_Chr11g01034551 [Helianthus anomalus]